MSKITNLTLAILVFSSPCFANAKEIKDPFGTVCTPSELTEVLSISPPKSKQELPADYRNLSWVKKNKKYVGIVVRKEKEGTKEQLMAMEKAHPGDSYFISQPFYVEENEVKKLKLRVGDKKYCMASVAPDGEDYPESY